MSADLILVFEVMISGWRTWILDGEIGFLWTDSNLTFGIGY